MAKRTIPDAIRALAMANPDVTMGVACAGTSLESTTYNINSKAFLFVRATPSGHELRLKAGGAWLKIAIGDTLPPDVAAQIAESYRAMAPKAKRRAHR